MFSIIHCVYRLRCNRVLKVNIYICINQNVVILHGTNVYDTAGKWCIYLIDCLGEWVSDLIIICQ